MSHPHEDPLVKSARREALVVTAFFLAAMAYTLTYCGINGYNRDSDSIQLVFGFPDWVFWGVIVPWVVSTIVSVVYALVFITDDPLGEAAENWNPEGAEPLPTQEHPHA
jgi:hypothetical protein